MKTAVSLPTDVFESAERLARSARKSRSQLYCDALREYVSRHSGDEITETMDRAIDGLSNTEDGDDFARASARAALERSEW